MGVFKTEPITWLTHPFLRFRMKASWGFLSLQLQILVRDSIKVDRVPCSGVGACTSSKTNESRSFLLFLNNQVCVSISYIFIQISVKTIPLLPPSGLCFYQDLSLTWSNFPTCNFVCPQTQGYQKVKSEGIQCLNFLQACSLSSWLNFLSFWQFQQYRGGWGLGWGCGGEMPEGKCTQRQPSWKSPYRKGRALSPS